MPAIKQVGVIISIKFRQVHAVRKAITRLVMCYVQPLWTSFGIVMGHFDTFSLGCKSTAFEATRSKNFINTTKPSWVEIIVLVIRVLLLNLAFLSKCVADYPNKSLFAILSICTVPDV